MLIFCVFAGHLTTVEGDAAMKCELVGLQFLTTTETSDRSRRGVAWPRGLVQFSNPSGVQSGQRWNGVAWALSSAWNDLE